MPRPTPQHGLNIQLPFPFSSLHALTLYMHSPPQASLYVVCVCVCVCVNVLHVHPTVYLFSPPLSSSCETGRKASIILMTITTCVSICWPQMSRRAAVWLGSESAPKGRRKQRQGDLGVSVWRSVTNVGPGPVNTSSQSVTETHGRQQGSCV